MVSWLWYPAYYHLDFFYGLAIIYTVFAFWRPTPKYPLVGMIASLAAVIIFGNVLASMVTGAAARALYYAGYLAFAIGGFYAGQLTISKALGRLLACAGISCLLAAGVATYIVSRAAGALDQSYYDYCSPFVAVGSFMLFVAACHTLPSRTPGSFISLLDRASLPIYCVHPFIVATIIKIFPVWVASPLIAVPAIVAFSMSLVLAMVAAT